MTMTFDAFHAAVTVGSAVYSTAVLEQYPTYFIQPQARFVVVAKDSDDVWLRLITADENKLTSGCLQEWGNQVHVPREFWTDGDNVHFPLPVVVDNDVVPGVERIAAVYTAMLAQRIGPAAMMDAAVSKNEDDFCDANQIMINATEAVLGRPVLLVDDVEEGRATQEEHDDQMDLTQEAWTIAHQYYMEVYSKASGGPESQNLAQPPADDDATRQHADGTVEYLVMVAGLDRRTAQDMVDRDHRSIAKALEYDVPTTETALAILGRAFRGIDSAI